MSQYLIEMLASRFQFTEAEKDILAKTKASLNKEERKVFYQNINPNRRQHTEYLMEQYELLGANEREKWYELTVESMLDKGGDADIVDELVIEIIGRIKVYSGLKERSQKEGRPVKAIASGGGCLFFFTLGVIVVAIISIAFSGFR